MRKTKRRIGHHLIAGGVFVWIALSVAVNFSPTQVFAVSTSDVFSLSNQQRISNGLTGFVSSSKLNSSAQSKAQHMLSSGYFAHTAPDGTTAWSFISGAGYNYSAAAENLASGNQGASAVVQGWMNSSGHRANLLSTTYTEVGYGVVYVGDWLYNGVTYSNTYFVVAHYGLPVASSPQQTTPEPEPQPQPAQQLEQTQVQSEQTEQQQEPQEEVIEELEEQQAEVEPEPVAEEPEENDSTAPFASVVKDDSNIIGPRMAVALATLAFGVIAAGVVLEIRYVKHHSHLGVSLPHLHG